MNEALEYTAVKMSISKIESFAEFVSIENEEMIINKFLDKVNKFSNDLNRLSSLFEDLENTLLQDFNKYTSEHREYLITELNSLRTKSIKLYVTLNNTTYAKGMKTSIVRFKATIDNLKEFIIDFKTVENLNLNEEYNLLIESLIK